MPELFPIDVNVTRPTQIAVGEREVAGKLASLSSMDVASVEIYLLGHPVPLIAGPGKVWYALDRHHLCRAAQKAGLTKVYGLVAGSICSAGEDSFWRQMHARAWAYPYDRNGVLRRFEAMPSSFAEMEDDPYRSLAGAVRNAAGFLKSKEPFSEFRWADHFRRHVALETVESSFQEAVALAMRVAGEPAASDLPGFIGEERFA